MIRALLVSFAKKYAGILAVPWSRPHCMTLALSTEFVHQWVPNELSWILGYQFATALKLHVVPRLTRETTTWYHHKVDGWGRGYRQCCYLQP
jgi:hypothetical protein